MHNQNSIKNTKSIKKTKKNTNTKENSKTSIIKKYKFSFKNVKKYKAVNNYNDNDNDKFNNIDNNYSKSFTIRFTSRKFLSQTKSKIKRGPKLKINKQDLFAIYIGDNLYNLRKGKTIYKNKLDKYVFNEADEKCICQNILTFNKSKNINPDTNINTNLHDDCECGNMKIYGSQGKSGAVINSIKCGNNQNILKIINMSNYYMKMRTETNNYIFVELDGFTIQTLINNYVYKELPNNTINIINSGVCKNKYRSLKGYNLLEEATLGSGQDFLIKLLSGLYDDDFNIKNEDNRYVAITNYLLQVICIIGHLQSSKLEFFHGDYKPENVFVKKSDKKSLPVFTFKVFGKSIQVKNIGFVVLIADFDKSSITIEEEFNQKKYRIISPIVYKLFLRGSVNSIIKKYGDIDPDSSFLKKQDLENPARKISRAKNDNEEVSYNYSSPKGVKFEKLFISHLVPKRMDPTMTVLRSAGIKLFRDFDLYTFFIKLLDSTRIREYFMTKRFNVTLMSFMSPKFINALYDMPSKETSISESAYITIDILNKIKEPMHSVFSDYYVETLSALNYRLFR
jgi:hypothetical protein